MAHDPTLKLYGRFTAPERLTLTLQAMARNDEAEVLRLRDSCPRKDYSGNDIAFTERMDLLFDTMAVVCIDIRWLWGKLHVLNWAIEAVQGICTLHHVNADMAFHEGIAYGEGRPQMPFYAGKLADLSGIKFDGSFDEVNDNLDDTEQEQETESPEDANEEEAESDKEQAGADESSAGDDFTKRAAAVSARSEHASQFMDLVLQRTAHDVAKMLLETWEAFGRFTRTRVGLEPSEVLKAWGFPIVDDLESVLDAYGHVKLDEAKVVEYSEMIRARGTGDSARRIPLLCEAVCV